MKLLTRALAVIAIVIEVTRAGNCLYRLPDNSHSTAMDQSRYPIFQWGGGMMNDGNILPCYNICDWRGKHRGANDVWIQGDCKDTPTDTTKGWCQYTHNEIDGNYYGKHCVSKSTSIHNNGCTVNQQCWANTYGFTGNEMLMNVPGTTTMQPGADTHYQTIADTKQWESNNENRQYFYPYIWYARWQCKMFKQFKNPNGSLVDVFLWGDEVDSRMYTNSKVQKQFHVGYWINSAYMNSKLNGYQEWNCLGSQVAYICSFQPTTSDGGFWSSWSHTFNGMVRQKTGYFSPVVTGCQCTDLTFDTLPTTMTYAFGQGMIEFQSFANLKAKAWTNSACNRLLTEPTISIVNSQYIESQWISIATNGSLMVNTSIFGNKEQAFQLNYISTCCNVKSKMITVKICTTYMRTAHWRERHYVIEGAESLTISASDQDGMFDLSENTCGISDRRLFADEGLNTPYNNPSISPYIHNAVDQSVGQDFTISSGAPIPTNGLVLYVKRQSNYDNYPVKQRIVIEKCGGEYWSVSPSEVTYILDQNTADYVVPKETFDSQFTFYPMSMQGWDTSSHSTPAIYPEDGVERFCQGTVYFFTPKDKNGKKPNSIEEALNSPYKHSHVSRYNQAYKCLYSWFSFDQTPGILDYCWCTDIGGEKVADSVEQETGSQCTGKLWSLRRYYDDAYGNDNKAASTGNLWNQVKSQYTSQQYEWSYKWDNPQSEIGTHMNVFRYDSAPNHEKSVWCETKRPRSRCLQKDFRLCLDASCVTLFTGTNVSLYSDWRLSKNKAQNLKIKRNLPMHQQVLYLVARSRGQKMVAQKWTIAVCGHDIPTRKIDKVDKTLGPQVCNGCGGYFEYSHTDLLNNWFNNPQLECKLQRFEAYTDAALTNLAPTTLIQTVGTDGVDSRLRIYYHNPGRHYLYIVPRRKYGALGWSAVHLNLTFCEHLYFSTSGAQEYDMAFQVLATWHNMFNYIYDFMPQPHNRTTHCPTYFTLKTAEGTVIPLHSNPSLKVNAYHWYNTNHMLHVYRGTPFVRTQWQIVASNPWGDSVSRSFWVEVCGTQTLKPGPTQDIILLKGQNGGQVVIPALELFNNFTFATNPGSKCKFTRSQMMLHHDKRYVWNDRWSRVVLRDPYHEQMGTIYINTNNGFERLMFWLKYEHETTVVAYQEYFIEVCGDQVSTCDQSLNLSILWKNPTPVTWTPSQIESKYQLSFHGVHCGYQNWALYNEPNLQTQWTNPKIQKDSNSPAGYGVRGKTPDGYIIDISARMHLKFYMMARSPGKTCVTSYEIEVCDFEVNTTSFQSDFALPQYSFDGGIMVPLTYLFTVKETNQCYFQNYEIMKYNQSVQAYVNYTRAYEVINIQKTGDPSVSQTNVTFKTHMPFFLDNKADTVTFKVQNRFNQIWYKNVSLLVCGGEFVMASIGELEFNYTYLDINNDTGLQQMIIPNASRNFQTTIPDCPITVYQLVDPKTNTSWTKNRIKLDLPRNQINVTTKMNMHEKVDFVALTESGKGITKIVTINVCGAQNITHAYNNTSKFSFDLNNETLSLVLQDNLTTNITEYFINSDPLCEWMSFSLIKLDKQKNEYVPFVSDLVTLDTSALQIYVHTTAKMNDSFYLNATTKGGPWQLHKFEVFICGEEEIEVTGGNEKVSIKYWWDDTYNVTAEKIIQSFESDIARCPVVQYYLAKPVAGDGKPQLLKSLDGDLLTIGEDDEPTVKMNLKRAYAEFPNEITVINIMGCSNAWKCGIVELELDKINCKEIPVTSDGIVITQEVKTQEEPVVISKDLYIESLRSDNDKCPVTVYGLLWEVDKNVYPRVDLNNIITMKGNGGDIEMLSEDILALGETTKSFQIVGMSAVGKRAYKQVNLNIIFPVNEEEAKEEKKDDINAVAGTFGGISIRNKVGSSSGSGFKGVAMDSVDSKGKESENEEVKEKPKPPQMSIDPLSSNGQMTIRFDQDMLFPPILNQKMYNQIFRITYISNGGDVKFETQAFKELNNTEDTAKNETKRKLEGEVEEELDWQFVGLEVTNHTARLIQFQFEFNQPALISRGTTKDELSITILEPGLFVAKETLMPIEITKNSRILKIIPPQMDEASKKSLLDAANNAKAALMTAGSTNIVVAQLIGGSVQIFWAMMRALQLIVLNGIINSPQPSHVSIFMQTLLNMAQYDIFDAQQIYQLFLKIRPTEPMNSNYEFFGIEGKNFLINSGSFFPFIIIMTAQNFFEWLMNIVALMLARFNCCRKIGTKIYLSKQQGTWMFPYQKLFMEVYFDLYLVTMLHTYAFVYENDGKGLAAFMEFRDDKWITPLVFLMILLTWYFPVWAFRVINNNFKKIDSRKIQIRYQLLLEDYRTENKTRAMYVFFFIVRRFVSAINLIVLQSYPYFQIVVLLAMSVINMNYLIGSRPLRNSNILELINELTIYLVILLMANFMNTAMPTKLADDMGWVLIGIVSMNMFNNICITGYQTGKVFISERKYAYNKFKVDGFIKQNLNTRKILKERFPEDTEFYKALEEEQEAIEFVKEWFDQRRWLRANKIKIKKLPEEKKYQKLIDKYHLLEKAFVQRVNLSMNYIAVKHTQAKIERVRIRRNLEKSACKEQFQAQIAKIKAVREEQKEKSQQESEEESKEESKENNQKPEEEKKEEQPEEEKDEKFKKLNKLKIENKDKKAGLISKNRHSWSTIGSMAKQNTQLQEIVNQSKAIKMIEIKEEDGEEATDDEKFDAQQIFRAKHDQLHNIPKLKRMVMLQNTIADMHKDIELQNIVKITPLQYEVEEKKMLPGLVKQTKEFLNQKHMSQFQKQVYEDMQKQKNDLTFLLDKDFEDYGDELEKVLKNDDHDLMNQYHKHNGICIMAGGGKNDYLQALFQCFIRIEPFARFFITKMYRLGAPENQRFKLCERITSLFYDVNTDQIDIIQKMNPDAALYDIVGYLERKIKGKDHLGNIDVGEFLTEFFKFVKEELGLVKDKKPTTEAQKYWLNLMCITKKNCYLCENGHDTSFTDKLLSSLKIPPALTIEESFQQYFDLEVADRKCWKCKVKTPVESFRRKEISSPPEILLLKIDMFTEQSKIKLTTFKEIPRKINLKKLMGNQLVDGSEPEYSLVGLIDLQGPDLENSRYTAFVKRKSPETKGKNLWLCVHKQDKFFNHIDTVLKHTKPQLLVYLKKKDM